MYLPQIVDIQPWAAGAPLTFNLSNLLSQAGGAPLHVVEYVILIQAKIDNSGAAFDGYELARILQTVRAIPNQPCDQSILSGHAIQSIDMAMTGRRSYEPAQIAATTDDQIRSIAVRLPFHGGLIGAKSLLYKDLISPVIRWDHGQFIITCSAANPFSDAGGVIELCDITLIAVTEPYPTEYVEGPAVIYGETIDTTGADTTYYPSAGRTMYLGLHPLDRIASAAIYPWLGFKAMCAMSGITPEQMAAVWNAMCSMGDYGDNVLDLDIPQFLPIVFTRPIAPQWTLPVFTPGNRQITLTGNTANEHRLVWAQLHRSTGALEQLAARTGGTVPNVVIDLDRVDAGDAQKLIAMGPTLPREIPTVRSIEQRPATTGDILLTPVRA